MAARSTRNKIKWQVKQAMKHLDTVMLDLKKTTDMADGRCPFTEEHVPGLVLVLDGVKILLDQYYDML